MGIEEAKGEALGLSGEARGKGGARVRAGSFVVLRGEVLRVHAASGFCVVRVEGEVGQPAVLAHAGNLEART